jgi:hypothetical protein
MLFPEPETAPGTRERLQVKPEVIPKRNALLGILARPTFACYSCKIMLQQLTNSFNNLDETSTTYEESVVAQS